MLQSIPETLSPAPFGTVYFIEIWVKLDCAMSPLVRKLTFKAKAAMQILLQITQHTKLAWLSPTVSPTYSYIALVIVIPNIIRLKEETAVPRKICSECPHQCGLS